MAKVAVSTLPTYSDLMPPVLRAVEALGGSAKSSEITAQVVENTGISEEQLAGPTKRGRNRSWPTGSPGRSLTQARRCAGQPKAVGMWT